MPNAEGCRTLKNLLLLVFLYTRFFPSCPVIVVSNSGKLTEKDAIQAALTKKQIDETMKEIKDLFTISGNGALYADAMQELANARKRRLDEVKRKQKERKELIDMIKLGTNRH